MELFNLLETGLPVFGQTFDVSLNWIGRLIRWICNGVGVVGVGIILFSLILKAITLPLDIFQRISMRKQNQQMKANQEKMEKLQKQYANDKDKYNQKLMEMYKENGISLLSSCLPMILSLVIFIVAINAFNAYAQYANVENYNTLVDAYNGELKRYSVTLTEDNYDKVVTYATSDDGKTVSYVVKDDTAEIFVYYKATLSAETTANMSKTELVTAINAYPDKDYYVDETRAIAENPEIAAYAQDKTNKGEAVKEYLVGKAQDSVVVAYNNQVKSKTKFLWIKNIWETDAVYSTGNSCGCSFTKITPVLEAEEFTKEAKSEDFKVGKKKVSYGKISGYTNAYTGEAYDAVTAKLAPQKDQANGYYVLILLSIGTIVLQQFVTMHSQKEQQKYSTVDGMGGSQQKMMMVMMPVMFAVFAFMYSSAFSLYMIISNLFSLCSTLIINKCVDVKMEKKQAAVTAQKYTNNTLARIEKAKSAGKKSAEESKKKNK